MRNFLSEHPFAGLAVLAVVVAATAAAKAQRIEPWREVTRLREHFRIVEAELTARDVSDLSAQQQAARARHIEVLREYARADVFPHNHDYPGKRVPYFRDAHGTLCAMAYLIARSGRQDLVDRVARTANNAYLPELARDPDLRAWLEANGLTVAEAARIQPAYGETPGTQFHEDHDYERATVAASVVSGGVITWTLLSDPKRRNYLPGMAAIGVGIADLWLAFGGGVSGEGGDLPQLNAIVGGVTTLAGVVSTIRVLNARSRGDQSPATSSQSQAWQPVLHNDASGRTHLGLTLRF